MSSPNKILAKAKERVHQEIEDLLDEGEVTVPFRTCEDIAEEVGIALASVVALFKDYGVKVEDRAVPKHVRGFKSNPNTRWSACPSHGGSGWEQISGFAGKEG